MFAHKISLYLKTINKKILIALGIGTVVLLVSIAFVINQAKSTFNSNEELSTSQIDTVKDEILTNELNLTEETPINISTPTKKATSIVKPKSTDNYQIFNVTHKVRAIYISEPLSDTYYRFDLSLKAPKDIKIIKQESGVSVKGSNYTLNLSFPYEGHSEPFNNPKVVKLSDNIHRKTTPQDNSPQVTFGYIGDLSAKVSQNCPDLGETTATHCGSSILALPNAALRASCTVANQVDLKICDRILLSVIGKDSFAKEFTVARPKITSIKIRETFVTPDTQVPSTMMTVIKPGQYDFQSIKNIYIGLDLFCNKKICNTTYARESPMLILEVQYNNGKSIVLDEKNFSININKEVFYVFDGQYKPWDIVSHPEATNATKADIYIKLKGTDLKQKVITVSKDDQVINITNATTAYIEIIAQSHDLIPFATGLAVTIKDPDTNKVLASGKLNKFGYLLLKWSANYTNIPTPGKKLVFTLNSSTKKQYSLDLNLMDANPKLLSANTYEVNMSSWQSILIILK